MKYHNNLSINENRHNSAQPSSDSEAGGRIYWHSHKHVDGLAESQTRPTVLSTAKQTILLYSGRFTAMGTKSSENTLTYRYTAREAGLIHYFTGKPCRNGHIVARYVSTRRCVQCALNGSGLWRGKNPEFLDHLCRNKKLGRDGRWILTSRDLTNERARNRYAENPSKRRLSALLWQVKNPDKVRAKTHRRRARKINAEGTHTAEDIQRIYKLQNGKCGNCRRNLSKYYQVDHILALSKGGTNWPRNLQILCKKCNCSKNASDPIDWAQRNGRLC